MMSDNSGSIIKAVGEVGPVSLASIPGGRTIQMRLRGTLQRGGVVGGLTNDAAVELARLLIKTAAANGWGSDEDRERLIAWAPVKRTP